MTSSSSAPLTLLPDAEQVLSAWLREQPELVAILGDRVYTAFPAKSGEGALAVIRRYGGEPPVARPLVLDEALLQVDCYAAESSGGKAQAYDVAAVIRALCSERTTGANGNPSVRVGALRYVPDETFKPPRPRYVCDLTVFVRPTVAPPAAIPKARAAVAPLRSREEARA